MSLQGPTARRRGASLVEALVALAIMAFGMLSLIGVQATMRLNSDLAKQRTEATRIATEDIERQRRFSLMAADGAQPNASYEEIQSLTVDPYVAPGGFGNTSYRVERTVTTVAEPKQKVLTVRVLWNDRTGTPQTVTVDAVISATDPSLSGLLAVPPVPSATNQRNGRHINIPPAAVDQGDGTSRFEPPGAVGVVWYFNNLTGSLSVCGANGCVDAIPLIGRVEFQPGYELNLAPGQPLTLTIPFAADLSSAVCFAPSNSPAASVVEYSCYLRPVTGAGGKLDVQLDGGLPNGYKVCRYTRANSDFTNNSDHPKTYCMETPPASNPTLACSGGRVKPPGLMFQRFYVVGSGSCPAGTLQHQP